MINNRTQSRSIKSRASSIKSRVTRISRHRSKRKERLNNIIHVTIRPQNNTRLIDNRSIHCQTNTSTILSPIVHIYHDEENDKQKSIISRESTAYSKDTHNNSSDRVLRLQRSLSKSSGNTWLSNTSIKRTARCKENPFNNSENISNLTTWLQNSSKVSNDENNDHFHIKMSNTSMCHYNYACNIIVVTILCVILLKFNNTKTTIVPNLTASLRWNTNGITIAGNSDDSLNFPTDIAVDYAHAFYITEYGNYRVQKYLRDASSGLTVAGSANGSFGSSSSLLVSPSRVIIDSNGGIYVTDTYNNRIQFWANVASVGTTVAGMGGIGNLNNQLNTPYGIARDSNTGTLYVTDYGNNRIMSYESGASSGNTVAGGNGGGSNSNQLHNPFGLYFDSLSNSLVITNLITHDVVRWVLGATAWTSLAGNGSGVTGTTSTLLNSPSDVTFDPLGNMYVSDAVNCRIQLFMVGNSQGITIEGISGVCGNNSTMLNLPYAVELDSQLNLNVADTLNNRIQKFIRY